MDDHDDNRDMDPAIRAVQGGLHLALGVLRGMESFLRSLLNFLPPSPEEGDPGLDLEETDARTELRSGILCVLEDGLRPAIEGLRAVVAAGRGEGDD
jgi:hypothetical protein